MGLMFMFSSVPIIMVFMFCLVFGLIIGRLLYGTARWNENNNSPILTVEARVVGKRTMVGHNGHGHARDMHMINHGYTKYYVTFEFESGDRLELFIPGSEFGLISEGDEGRLTFQNTRYVRFERNRRTFQ